MATHVEAGSAIECDKSLIAVRKKTENPTFLKLEKLDGEFIKVYKYKSRINSLVVIKQELDPKEQIISEDSFLDLHDELSADVLEIYTEKRVTLELESNFSSVHGIQWNEIKCFTYAKIIIPWRYVTQKLLSA